VFVVEIMLCWRRWALLAGVAACSGQDKAATPASGGETGVQFALTSSCLPTCGPSQDGEVYYVWSDSKFYVCRASTRTWVQTNLNGASAAVSVTPVSPGSQCKAGGSKHRVRPGPERQRQT